MKDEGRTRSPLGRTGAHVWTLALFLTFVLHPSSFVLGADSNAIGTTAAPFLKLSPDARAAALGGAFTASADGASAVYFNPAGLAPLRQASVLFSQAFYLDSASYQSLAFAQPLSALLYQPPPGLPPVEPGPDWGVVGLGLLYFNAGNIPRLDNTGAPDGSFSPRDLAASLCYARGWGPADLGACAEYVDSKIQRNDNTLSSALGVRTRNLPDRRWNLGLALRHLGGGLDYGGHRDPLPTLLQGGGDFTLFPGLRLSADLAVPNDNRAFLSAGAQLVQPVGGYDAALRLGYNGRDYGSGLSGAAGVAAGAGLAWPGFAVDYAWVPFGILGDTHRVSLSLRF